MMERYQFGYPPYRYLIDVWFKHRDASLVAAAAQVFANKIHPSFPDSVFGPFAPFVSRVKGINLQKLTIKIDPKFSLSKVKTYLYKTHEFLRHDAIYRSVLVYFDVDPV